MKVSVIDIGTNTFKLLIAESTDGNFRISRVEKRGVKLGEGSYRSRQISSEAMGRAIKALKEFQLIIDNESAEQPVALATAAVRDTENGSEFVEQIRKNTGIKIETITGEREAELIAAGVLSALDHQPGHLLIMDIGGGSTEFIEIKDKQTVWRKSFPLGAARLLQELEPSDPVSRDDVNRLYQYLSEHLHEIKNHFQPGVTKLVGCSGSFETFADMIALEILKKNETPAVSSMPLESEILMRLFRELQSKNREQRLKMKGLPEYRVDTIVFGALAVQWLKNELKPAKIITSYRSMKEGVVSEIINNRM